MADQTNDDNLQVAIQAGADYVPTPRVVAALDELIDALNEAAEAEVEGFSYEMSKSDGLVGRPRGFRFDAHLGLCNNEVIEGEWKL